MKKIFALVLCIALTGAAVSADTAVTTSAGIAFTVPKDWTEQVAGPVVTLTAPENDTTLWIVDAGKAKDSQSAVDAAWAAAGTKPDHPLEMVNSSPGRGGWDEIKTFNYQTSPNEHLVVIANALRHGDAWTVLLIKGSEATMEKRAANIGLIGGTIRPASYKQETFAGRTAHHLDAQRVAQLRSFLQTGMQQLGIPGVGWALTERGKIVYEGGLGVREIGKPQRVDANTEFMIASNTKGMTTLLLARLVDQGKLRWNEPVTQAYPSFRLGSDATTKAVLISNLVCACTGLPRKDFDWIFNTTATTPASTTFTQLAATEPTSKFGEVFQYNNLMASAAGYIAGHLVYPKMEIGAAYDRAMQTMIFDPLGMRSATFDTRRAMATDHASPHGFDVNGNVAEGGNAFNAVIYPYRPAGGAWVSTHDMTKYVQLELTQGVLPNGKRLVSAKNLLERRKPSVPLGKDQYYGMGLMTDSHLGVTVIHHGGDLAGFHSDWFAIPSAQVGAVILTNGDAGPTLRGAFLRRLLEVLYDGQPQAAASVAAAAVTQKEAMAKSRQELVVPADPKLAAQLASRYENPDLGHIDVTRDANGVKFDFGLWHSYVATHKNPDGTVSFVTIDPVVAGFDFLIGSDGGKRTLTTHDGQHKYVYVEK